MNACCREENQEGVDYFLVMMKDIMSTKAEEFSCQS